MTHEWMHKAGVAMAQGQLPLAESLAHKALEGDPESVPASVLLGMIESRTGRADSALARFGSVIAKDPGNFDAVFWSSVLLRQAGRNDESLAFAERAVHLLPEEAHVHSNLGLTLLAKQQFETALSCFERSANLNPKLGPNYHHMGMAYQFLGRDSEASASFRKALEINPNSMDTLLALGQSLMNQADTAGAIECAQRAIHVNPKSAPSYLLKASALIGESRSAEAEDCIRKAVELNPKESNAYAMLGMRLQSLGRMEEANDSFRKSIEIQPEQGFAYCALIRNKKTEPGDQPMLDRMEKLASDPKLPPRGQSFLEFGLGKAYEDLKKYEKAMRHFDLANRIAYRLRFGDRPFAKKRYEAFFDWSIKTFTPEFFEQHRKAGLASAEPVFIVGMMRSGTTLVEQILSSHPDVQAKGELPFWMTQRTVAIPVGSSELDEAKLRQLSNEYLKVLRAHVPLAKRYTDKMPDNYLPLGLIHIAFPNARFIHTKRDPLDTCISIYTTPNRTSDEYANDKGNIAFAYRQYLRLMEHWRAVIPAGRLFEVQYEQLVADREPVIRGMLDFCGLDWDDACLNPEQNERSVTTPSAWQVRQPVYSTSVRRWKNYEPWLGEFASLLQ